MELVFLLQLIEVSIIGVAFVYAYFSLLPRLKDLEQETRRIHTAVNNVPAGTPTMSEQQRVQTALLGRLETTLSLFEQQAVSFQKRQEENLTAAATKIWEVAEDVARVDEKVSS